MIQNLSTTCKITHNGRVLADESEQVCRFMGAIPILSLELCDMTSRYKSKRAKNLTRASEQTHVNPLVSSHQCPQALKKSAQIQPLNPSTVNMALKCHRTCAKTYDSRSKSLQNLTNALKSTFVCSNSLPLVVSIPLKEF